MVVVMEARASQMMPVHHFLVDKHNKIYQNKPGMKIQNHNYFTRKITFKNGLWRFFLHCVSIATGPNFNYSDQA